MHTLRLHIKTTAADEALLMKRFRLMNRIHNVLVKRCMALLAKLGNDRAYQGLLSAYRALGKDGNPKERKLLTAEMAAMRERIGLTKAALEKYISVEQKRYSAHITSHQAQAEVSRVWESVERVLFGNGKRLRFRKLESMRTIGGKSVNGVRFLSPINAGYFKKTVPSVPGWECQMEWNGLQAEVSCDLKDPYVYESLQHDIAYCEVERLPFAGGDRWYIILYLDGLAPKKILPGSSTIGIDPGVSTFNGVSETKAFLRELAPEAPARKKAIAAMQRKVERSVRASNPELYNSDGTVKKRRTVKTSRGSRKVPHEWKFSKRCLRKKQELRVMHRKCSAYVRQSHNELCNEIMADSVNAVMEPMDYAALAKRAKATSRREKASAVRKKDGSTVMVRRFRRKKRFGSSIGMRSPSIFLEILKRKIRQYGGTFLEVCRNSFRASQYDHSTDTFTKHPLSSRAKEIGGHTVQRDLYSAFLIRNTRPDLQAADREKCTSTFSSFLELQAKAVLDTQLLGMSMPACFGF